MKPHDAYRNGDGGVVGEDSSEEETSALEQELSMRDDAAPARVLNALNALRKSRQHYDAVLLAGGAELPAHRAVLAAASPYLLQALSGLPAPAPASPAVRVEHVEPAALGALVEYAYTGRLRVRSAAAARSLYLAAWRLRVEPVRAHLASALLRRVAPHDVLELRALPDLSADQLQQLDAYIAQNFDEVCKSGALATLPLIRIEMLRETSAEGGEETAFAVADAALIWLRDQQAVNADLDELCARTHLLYVDAGGALRDCGELPAARGDAPELHEYRREAAERGRAGRRAEQAAPAPAPPAPALGERTARAACCVLAATRVPGARTTRALLALRGRLAAARVAWRDAAWRAAACWAARATRARRASGARACRWAARRTARRCWTAACWCAAGTTARACCGRRRPTTRRSTSGRHSRTCAARALGSRPRCWAARCSRWAARTGTPSWTRWRRWVRRAGQVARACRWRCRTRARRRWRSGASCTWWAAGPAASTSSACCATTPTPTPGARPRRSTPVGHSVLAYIGRARYGRWAAATRGTASPAPSACGWGRRPRRSGSRAPRCPRRGAPWARRRGAAGWWPPAGRTARRPCGARSGWRRTAAGAPGPSCAGRAPRWGWPCCTTRSTPSAASTARSSCRVWSACTSPTASGPRCWRPPRPVHRSRPPRPSLRTMARQRASDARRTGRPLR